jgi:hypothetical protein
MTNLSLSMKLRCTLSNQRQCHQLCEIAALSKSLAMQASQRNRGAVARFDRLHRTPVIGSLFIVGMANASDMRRVAVVLRPNRLRPAVF